MLQISFTPFPVLTTERLLLQQITEADADALFALRSDPSTMQYIPRPLLKSMPDVLKLIASFDHGIHQNERITWGIYSKTDKAATLIGTIGYVNIAPEHFRAEVGYLLHPGQRGKGIMTEALKAVVDYGYNMMKFHSIEAIVNPENKESMLLLERNAFTKAGYFKDYQFFEGQFIDSVFYLKVNEP
jgi:[ribosomal protein S5]-alanine N-acetyltransferase